MSAASAEDNGIDAISAVGPLINRLSTMARAPLPPIDPARVAVGVERWLTAADEAGLGAETRALQAHPDIATLAAAIFGTSPFLTECWVRDPAFLADLMAGDEAVIVASLIDEVAALATVPDVAQVMRAMRIAKRRVALAVAIADIAGLWPLEKVTESLSALAAASLDAAVGHILGLRIGDFELESLARAKRGLIILGMGKLGARELNYSSDIDLIILYDEPLVDPILRAAQGRLTLSELYVRLSRDVVRLLSERTADGYVFRTDLRLRPDPSSTPVAISVDGAENYYGSVGQNWERAAMIKARPVAGDIEAGERFLKHLRPFLWRRHLDFAAINDIHSIKRQIYATWGGATIAVEGHDIKLGRGGIREIEFYAQTLQLIWGGRDPALRVAGTCAALDALVAAGRVPPETAEDLKTAYRELRRVEHRLQMIDDQQTHRVPTEPESLTAIARFLGHEDTEAFASALRATLGVVENHYARLFEEAPSLAGPRNIKGNLVFTGFEDDPETLATLGRLGYRDGPAVSRSIRAWHHGRVRATNNLRARQLLTELMPALLDALAATPEPDVTFARFDRFMAALPAGVQLLSLIHARPEVLELIALIMGSSPRLADYLARRPVSLDAMLSEPFGAVPEVDRLRHELDIALDQATDFQDVLDAVRRWVGDRRFQIAARHLGGEVNDGAVARCLSDIAELVIERLLEAVETVFRAQHGLVEGGRFAVVAMGKLGGRELTPTSDLDLVFLYDPGAGDEDGSTPSVGGLKPLPASLYYQRLGQRLIAALTALTAEGELYTIDMRLRPSGNKGPVASSLSGFVAYQAEEAWTWEHMALTRARPLAGDAGLRDEIADALRRVIAAPRDLDKLVVDVADMRQRMAREFGSRGDFDIKNRRGGLIDIEFIAQYLLLATGDPALVSGDTMLAIGNLATAGRLSPAEASSLLDATRLWRRVQMMARLIGTTPDKPGWSTSLEPVLTRAAGAVDFAALRQDMSGAAQAVSRIFDRLIDAPANRLRPTPSLPETPK